MTTRLPIVALILILAASVSAAPQKILVLPLDGSADAATKAQLATTLQKLAGGGGGTVSKGDTTFTETASAVGCDPSAATCATTVLDTLAVDEVVYGTANTENGTTTVVVKRAQRGEPPHEQTITIAPGDPADKTEAALAPAFGASGSGPAVGSGSAQPAVEGPGFFDTTERKVGVGLAAGGGALVIVGVVFWLSESGDQDTINKQPTQTLAQIQAVKALEDSAASKALTGNILFFAGLAAAGVGGYYLYKDHENREAAITPAPAANGTGMTLVLQGRW